MAFPATRVDASGRREPRDRLALLHSQTPLRPQHPAAVAATPEPADGALDDHPDSPVPDRVAADGQPAPDPGGRPAPTGEASDPGGDVRRPRTRPTTPARPRDRPQDAAADNGPSRHHRPGWLVRRWLPTGDGTVRLDPGRRSAVLLALVVLLAAAVAGVAVWRGRPVAQPAPGLPVVAPVGASAAAELVVSVAGQVARPGLVRLPPGARVADAVEAAGGPSPGADLGGLNLARRLTDGEHVLVTPVAAQPAASDPSAGQPGTGGAGSKVNLNTATLADLDTLPGVGPVTARRILDWRAANGRFASVDQLREVDGIGEARFAQLRDLVTT